MRSGSIFFLVIGITLAAPTAALAVWPHQSTEALLLSTGLGERTDAILCPDGAGGAIVAWTNGGKGDVYAQRISAAGKLLWGPEGIPICTEPHSQYVRGIISDEQGGAIVVWRDLRGVRYESIFVQRLSPQGALLWPADGVPVFQSLTAGGFLPAITSDADHGAIISFESARPRPDNPAQYTIDIFAQRIDASGAARWAPNGVLVNSELTNYRTHSLISADGAGGAVIAWEEWDVAGKQSVSVQRIDSSGLPQWNASGVPVGSTPSDLPGPRLMSDGAGGAMVAWTEWQSDSPTSTVRTQRVDASGSLQWGPAGTGVTGIPGYQAQVAIASDGADGLVATWSEDRTGNPVIDDTHFDVYGQHLNGAGARLWTEGGISVASAAGGQVAPQVISDGQQGWIVAWFDRRDSDPQIYAQRLDADGALQWTADGVQIMNQAIDILQVGMISDADGGAILTWSDRRFPPYLSVFAERVGRNGKLGVPGGPRPRTEADEQTLGWLTSRWIQNQVAIQFALSRSGPVRLDVHDVSGRRVRSWREDFVEAGVHERRFDLTDDRGRVLPAGVYFVNLDSRSGRLNQRLIVTK